MFQLALHVCLLSNPNSCHWEYRTSDAPSIAQCVSDQISLADWMSHNPKFTITDWHCNPNSKREANL